MPNSKSNTAVVTGVSTGIGNAIAKALIDADWHVYGSVRKEKDAEALVDAFGASFTPLIFDVTDESGVQDAARVVAEDLGGRRLSALINNAGIAVAGPMRYIDIDDIKRQFDINILGVVRTTQAFLPMLGADDTFKGRPGKIINMSSVAGKIASPFYGPYAMSKHALEALSDAMRRELTMHGIDVLIIGPGAVKTPIWDKGGEVDASTFDNTEYGAAIRGVQGMLQSVGESGVEAADVGALALSLLRSTNPPPRSAILNNKLMMWTLPRLLPTRMLDSILTKRFGVNEKPGA
ncbi:MAG: SDR family NAD(P)-dependent oxidoreductase [Pseudomonadota bacterium]